MYIETLLKTYGILWNWIELAAKQALVQDHVLSRETWTLTLGSKAFFSITALHINYYE